MQEEDESSSNSDSSIERHAMDKESENQKYIDAMIRKFKKGSFNENFKIRKAGSFGKYVRGHHKWAESKRKPTEL